MSIPDFDRPMSADQANFLLANIEKELKRRHEWDYNSKIKLTAIYDENIEVIICGIKAKTMVKIILL